MLEQPSLLSSAILVVVGLSFRWINTQRDDPIEDLDSRITALDDIARNQMVVPLAELLVDVVEYNVESSDTDSGPFESLLEGGSGSQSRKGKLRSAEKTIFQVIEDGYGSPRRPEARKLKELQEIRRGMRAGADLESAKQCRKKIGRCEWWLRRSLDMVMFLAIVELAPRLALWERFVGVNPVKAISYVNAALFILLLIAVGLRITSAVLHRRSKSIFEPYDIDP